MNTDLEIPKRRCPDVSKLKKLINDYPKITLKGGLNKTIRSYKLRTSENIKKEM